MSVGSRSFLWYNAYRKIFRMKKWESVWELQSLCGRYDLKTIFETRRRNFMCQLYDSSNSLVRVCYVVHMLHYWCFSVCTLCLSLSYLLYTCCTLYCSCCSCLRINVFIHSYRKASSAVMFLGVWIAILHCIDILSYWDCWMLRHCLTSKL